MIDIRTKNESERVFGMGRVTAHKAKILQSVAAIERDFAM
jgi:hypothetical protein